MVRFNWKIDASLKFIFSLFRLPFSHVCITIVRSWSGLRLFWGLLCFFIEANENKVFFEGAPPVNGKYWKFWKMEKLTFWKLEKLKELDCIAHIFEITKINYSNYSNYSNHRSWSNYGYCNNCCNHIMYTNICVSTASN